MADERTSSEKAWGQRLAEQMRARRLGVAELAKRVGVSPQAVGKWRAGGEIAYERLRAVAEVLQLDWIWLRYGDEAYFRAGPGTPWRGMQEVVVQRAYLSDLVLKSAQLNLACTVARLGIWSYLFADDVLTVDKRASEITGIRASQHPHGGALMADTIHPEDVERVMGAISQVLADRGVELTQTHRIVHRESGETFWVRRTTRYLYDSLGRPVQSFGVMQDVSFRVLQEAVIGEIFNTMRTPVGIAKPDGVLTFVNARVAELSGVPASSIVGLQLWEAPGFAGHEEQVREAFMEAVASVNEGKAAHIETTYQSSDGERAMPIALTPCFLEGVFVCLVAEGRGPRGADELVLDGRKPGSDNQR